MIAADVWVKEVRDRTERYLTMELVDYEKILHHLDAATSILLGHQGQLREVDIRIRHLLSITGTETKRCIREIEEGARRVIASSSPTE